MLRELLDRIDSWGKATTLVYLGALFGGLYLLVELVVGWAVIPADATLTPTAYFAFLTGGGAVLSVGNGIFKGHARAAEAAEFVKDLDGDPDPGVGEPDISDDELAGGAPAPRGSHTRLKG